MWCPNVLRAMDDAHITNHSIDWITSHCDANLIPVCWPQASVTPPFMLRTAWNSITRLFYFRCVDFITTFMATSNRLAEQQRFYYVVVIVRRGPTWNIYCLIDVILIEDVRQCADLALFFSDVASAKAHHTHLRICRSKCLLQRQKRIINKRRKTKQKKWRDKKKRMKISILLRIFVINKWGDPSIECKSCFTVSHVMIDQWPLATYAAHSSKSHQIICYHHATTPIRHWSRICGVFRRGRRYIVHSSRKRSSAKSLTFCFVRSPCHFHDHFIGLIWCLNSE